MDQQHSLPESASKSGTPLSRAAKLHEMPLRIYTLGRFSMVRHGEPLRHTRKAPQKPLQLLKVLIATGGRQVGCTYLASLMWPDKEGDLAQTSFDTTLHRLRKYLGDDRYIIIEDGRLTLNSDLVWVDVWTFERCLGELRGSLGQSADQDNASDIDYCAKTLLATYQGHFLVREEVTHWSVSIRERLRNKYIHSLIELGNYCEKHGLWNKAILCYQKGIEVDDLVETFYQRLMVCLDEVGRKPEAIAAYRQCRQILSVVLGLEPMDETQSVYHLIHADYRKAG